MGKETGKDCKNFQTECFKVENKEKIVECSRLECVGVCAVKQMIRVCCGVLF